MKTNFTDYMDDLIGQGYSNYASLPDDEKQHLTALYIEDDLLQRDCWLSDSSQYDIVLAQLRLIMKKDDVDVKEQLINRMKSIAVETYADDIAEEFNNEITNRLCDAYYENGYRKSIDQNNGEIIWSKA